RDDQIVQRLGACGQLLEYMVACLDAIVTGHAVVFAQVNCEDGCHVGSPWLRMSIRRAVDRASYEPEDRSPGDPAYIVFWTRADGGALRQIPLWTRSRRRKPRRGYASGSPMSRRFPE